LQKKSRLPIRASGLIEKQLELFIQLLFQLLSKDAAARFLTLATVLLDCFTLVLRFQSFDRQGDAAGFAVYRCDF
jgi:hypothetical protein